MTVTLVTGRDFDPDGLREQHGQQGRRQRQERRVRERASPTLDSFTAT